MEPDDEVTEILADHHNGRALIAPFVEALAAGMQLAKVMPTVYIEVAARLAGAAIASLDEEDRDDAVEVLNRWTAEAIEHHAHLQHIQPTSIQ